MTASPELPAVLKALLLPPGVLLFVALAGLAMSRRWPRFGVRTAITALVAMYALSTPIVASVLLLAIGCSTTPLDTAQARAAQAIVIPGGGLRRAAPEFGGDTLGRLTLERVRYGAMVARASGLPVLVSGGRPRGYEMSEADLMRGALEHEFSVAVRWIESESRNTRENAVRTAAILLPAGVQRIVLVVHAFDVPRARREFEAAGFDVIVAPTQLPRLSADELLDFLPQPSALQSSYYALYEMLALAVTPLRRGT